MSIVAACAGLTAPALADLPAYALVGQFDLPNDASWDFDSRGRIVAVVPDGRILRQSFPSSSSYQQIGAVDSTIFSGPFGNFGAGFLRISPNGSTIAIGDNEAAGRVHFVQSADLTPGATSPTTFITTPNFSAHWSDDSTLFVAGGFLSSRVSRLNPALGKATSVISGPDASAGVAIRSGRLYTGEGFSFGDPALTGNIRAFDLAALSSTTTPLPFSTGVLVADALSANALAFDALGNLLVGGGQSGGDEGYAAVIDAAAIATALAGGPSAPDSAELRLSPAGTRGYTTAFNTVTNELIVSSGQTAFRYAIPAPAAAPVALLRLFAIRRRRSGGSV